MTPPKNTENVSRAPTDRGRKTQQKFAPEEARQGQVVLSDPRRRWIFLAGVGGAIALAVVIALTIV
jgi:hypothetical protein